MDSNEELIIQLVGDTGCDREIAAMLLKFTSWDVDGAKRIIKAVPKDIFVIKGKFITQISGNYGSFFFCYDEKENQITKVLSVVSDEKEIGKIDVGASWREFENELFRYSKSNIIKGLKSEQLTNRFLSKEFLRDISDILSTGKTVKETAIKNLLVNELNNVIADTNVAVKYSMEMTDAFELNKGQQRIETGEEEEIEVDVDVQDVPLDVNHKSPWSGREQTLLVLRVDPVLAPVKGTEIKDLEFGDEIQVSVTDERDIADYLAELLGGKVNGLRVPVPTKIVEVSELEEGGASVLTQFGPGIMGLFKVLSDVKVMKEKELEEPKAQSVVKIKKLNPLFVIGGIALVIILFVLLIFLSR